MPVKYYRFVTVLYFLRVFLPNIAKGIPGKDVHFWAGYYTIPLKKLVLYSMLNTWM
jgi:hypothetical protein